MVNSIFGTSMAIVSALSWGGCTVLFKIWGKNYKPTNINLFNTTLSFFWLCCLVILTHSSVVISKESVITIAVSGFIGIVIADSIYYSALHLLSPVTLSLISILGTLFSGIWGFCFYGEIPDRTALFGILLVLTGAGIIYSKYPKNKELLKFKIYGAILAIIASLLTTFSIAIMKPVLQQNPPLTVTMYRMLFSSVVLMLYLLFSRKTAILKDTFFTENKCKSQIIITSFLYAIGGFYCSMLAIKNCNLVIVSSIMSVQPFFVLLIMILFFKYIPKITEFIGILLIIFGLLLFYID